ncbi:MAG: hypothetical protein WCG42_03305 [Parachlamydiaceae bacterium]
MYVVPQDILDLYEEKYRDNSEILSKLRKIINLYNKIPNIVQLARKLKEQYRERLCAIMNFRRGKLEWKRLQSNRELIVDEIVEESVSF